MRNLTAIFCVAMICTACIAPAQCQIAVTSLQPCLESGEPVIPFLGNRVYGIRVEWIVHGHAKAPYNVKFTMADASWVWKDVKATEPGYYHGVATFAMPLDGSIPISAVVDCDHQADNTTPADAERSSSFIPVYPPGPTIDYYGEKRWVASQSMIIDIAAHSGIEKIVYVFGVPNTETFERILEDRGVEGTSVVTSAPFGFDLYRKQVQTPEGGETELTHAFAVASSNVRGNLSAAMSSWAKYAALPKEIQPYLQPEKIVQSGDPRVRDFVRATLPVDFRKTMSPYQAARALFVAVAGKLTYEAPAKADAVSGLTLCKGDCGTFASLYVASLRSIGIPARNVCGWRSGKDQWHCWCEVYVPDAGWMPQDPTDCNTMWKFRHSKGGFAYFFADINDLNSRVVVSRGSTFQVGDSTWQTMQPGQWDVFGPNDLKNPTWTNHCSLVARE